MKQRGLAVIGDVHGCLQELENLLEAVNLHAQENDWEYHLVMVGDLVDRGPAAAQVVRLAVHLHENSVLSLVLGNHDEMLLQALLLYRPDLIRNADIDPEPMEDLVRFLRSDPKRMLTHWMRQGGISTVISYGGDPWKPATWHVPPEDIRLLATAPLVWSNGELTVTHAQADATAVQEALARADAPWSISDPSRESLLWNRDPPRDPPGGFHVSGHTVRLVPRVTPTSAQIDTGCCFGYTLTAFLWPERTLLTVPSSRPEVGV